MLRVYSVVPRRVDVVMVTRVGGGRGQVRDRIASRRLVAAAAVVAVAVVAPGSRPPTKSVKSDES